MVMTSCNLHPLSKDPYLQIQPHCEVLGVGQSVNMLTSRGHNSPRGRWQFTMTGVTVPSPPAPGVYPASFSPFSVSGFPLRVC